MDSALIERRLSSLEERAMILGIRADQLSEQIKLIAENEHKYYVTRNNLKHLCLSALPETVDALNTAIIEIIMSDKYDMAEHACEIIQQFNAKDITFLSHVIVCIMGLKPSPSRRSL